MARTYAERPTQLERAQEEGPLRTDVDLDDVVELIYAPMYYRLLLHTRLVKPAVVDAILRLSFERLAPKQKPRPRKAAKAARRA